MDKTLKLILFILFTYILNINANSYCTYVRNDTIEYAKDVQKLMNCMMEGNCKGAIPIYEKILREYYLYLDEMKIASYRRDLSVCYFMTGELGKGEHILIETYTELDKSNNIDNSIFRNLCVTLATYYFQVNNYLKAKQYYIKARTLYENASDFSDDFINCLSIGAETELALGNKIFAINNMELALTLMRKNLGYNESASFADLYSTLSKRTGKKRNNSKLPEKAETIFRKRAMIILLSNAAAIYEEVGQRADAIACIKESISICESIAEINALACNNISLLYMKEGEYEKALPYIEYAYKNACVPYEYNIIALNFIMMKYITRKSIASISEEISLKIRKNVNYHLGFLSNEERYHYWHKIENVLPIINSMIYEQNAFKKYGIIFDNILYTKGLLLKTDNAIRDAIISSNNEMEILLFEQYLSKKRQLYVEQDVQKREVLNKNIEMIEKQLLGNLKFSEGHNIDWKTVQRGLSADDIAIEFCNLPKIQQDEQTVIKAETRYCAVIVKQGYKYPHIIPLFIESDFEELEENNILLDNCLYTKIWEPLETELQSVKTIFFAPDRELHKIAIEYALIDEKQRMSDKYNMVRLSSTRELVERKDAMNPQSAVLYGGLKYDLDKDELIAESRKAGAKQLMASRAVENEALRYGVSYLKGTEEEVENIERDLRKKGIDCVTVSGNAGTEESFRALSGRSVDILHLATHGYFWSEEDAERRNYIPFLNGTGNTGMRAEDKAMLRSGLFFSGANVSLRGEELPDDVEDGVLTAMELSNLNLGKVDLVVLSACQSGLGETSGDGVFGLQRGFKLAGAKTLLMSLWKVDDKATQILMTEFYKNLLAGDTKVESLKKAQKVLQADETYKDPEYWAGWILLDALN